MEAFLKFRPGFLITGSVLFFAANRYFNADPYYHGLLGVALGLVIVGNVCCLRLAQVAKSKGFAGEARSWMYTFSWHLAILLSLLFYLVYESLLGTAVRPESLLEKALLAVWLLFLVGGIAGGIGLEMAQNSAGQGPHVDADRTARAGLSWLLVGIGLAILVNVNFAAAHKDKVYDLSYLKTTQAGDSTKKMLKSLSEDLEVFVFYPADNEVLPFVREYFDGLARYEPRVKVLYLDKDLSPKLAEEQRVSRNGQIVLRLGDKTKRLSLGLKIRSASTKLRKMDAEFQRLFLQLTETKRTVYFTQGHGELSWLKSQDSPMTSIRLLEPFMRNQNYTLRQFGVSQGSTKAVPEDASLVTIMGPTRPFMPQEIEALRKYVKSGGRLLVFLDMEKDLSENAIVSKGKKPVRPLYDFVKEELGVSYNRVMLASETQYVTATRSQADRWFLYTNIFTSHESVASLAKHEERIPMFVFKAGYLSREERPNWKVQETVRTLPSSFTDRNKNFQYDKSDEQKATYALGVAATAEFEVEAAKAQPEAEPKGEQHPAAATKKTAKIIVFSDATAFSDAVIGAGPPGNALFIADSLKWLTDRSEFSGETVSEEDVKIRHSKEEDLVWFHLSIFGVPSLVLLAGFVANTRRRKRTS